MKPALWCIVLFANLLSALAQGSIGTPTNIVANLIGPAEQPPNDSPYVGTATLSYNLLTYNPSNSTTLACRVDLPLPFSPTSAGVYGPATVEQTGPLIFDLGQCSMVTNIITVIAWPPVPDPPTVTNVSAVYTNTLTLTPQQMNDLNAGLWYVNVTSVAYPAGELRGQMNGAPLLSQPAFDGGSGFVFKVIAPPGRSYEVDLSTNLQDWSALTNINSTNALFQVTDPEATNSCRRFYRVRSP